MTTRSAKCLRRLVVLCLAALAAAPPAWADDAFARITGSGGLILGDQPPISGLPEATGAIQIFSTGFGLSVPALAKPVNTPLTFVKRFDRASPRLLRAAFVGEPLTVEITWYMRIDFTPKKTATVRLDGAMITGIDAAASLTGNDASGFENVSLSYQRITFTTPILDAKGNETGRSTVCIDVVNARLC